MRELVTSNRTTPEVAGSASPATSTIFLGDLLRWEAIGRSGSRRFRRILNRRSTGRILGGV